MPLRADFAFTQKGHLHALAQLAWAADPSPCQSCSCSQSPLACYGGVSLAQIQCSGRDQEPNLDQLKTTTCGRWAVSVLCVHDCSWIPGATADTMRNGPLGFQALSTWCMQRASQDAHTPALPVCHVMLSLCAKVSGCRGCICLLDCSEYTDRALRSSRLQDSLLLGLWQAISFRRSTAESL